MVCVSTQNQFIPSYVETPILEFDSTQQLDYLFKSCLDLLFSNIRRQFSLSVNQSAQSGLLNSVVLVVYLS